MGGFDVNAFMCGLMTATALASMLVLAVVDRCVVFAGQSGAVPDGSTVLGPRFRLLSYRRHHLPLLVRGMEELGLTESVNASLSMHDVHNFDVLWSYPYPDFNRFGSVLPHTRINHLRGNVMLTRKKDLFHTFEKARNEFGEALFDFLPEHFLIPEQGDAFKARVRRDADHGTTIAADPNFGQRWIAKSRDHGGIKLVQGAEVGELARSKKSMVSQYVEPMLVDGYKWDFGLYVLVTSIHPLRMYVHGNGLVRMCLKPYPKEGLHAGEDVKRYVVKDYSAPWDKPTLGKRYERFPTTDSQGTFHSLAICEHIDSLNLPGRSCAEWWEGMKATAAKMVLHALPRLRTLSRESSSFRDTHFELFRLDFNTDPSGKPWLVEINMSPNLLPKYFMTGNDAAMKASVVRGALGIVGPQARTDRPNPFAPGEGDNAVRGCGAAERDEGAVEAGVEALADDDKLACVLDALARESDAKHECGVCLPREALAAVAKLVFEYTQRGDYELAFPPVKVFDSDSRLTRLSEAAHAALWRDEVGVVAKARADTLLDHVAAKLFARPTSSLERLLDGAVRDRLKGTCKTRGHCGHRGTCVAGGCRCDANWSGPACGEYHGPSPPSFPGGWGLYDLGWPVAIVALGVLATAETAAGRRLRVRLLTRDTKKR